MEEMAKRVALILICLTIANRVQGIRTFVWA